MLTLIKIRAKYLSRHTCGVFWSYLFIPIMVIINFIPYLFRPRGTISFSEKMKNSTIILQNFKELFNKNFNLNPQNYLILTDEMNDCNIINKIVKEDFSSNQTFECSTKGVDSDKMERNIVIVLVQICVDWKK